MGSATSTGVVQIFTSIPISRSRAIVSAWKSAVVRGASSTVREAPSLHRISSSWAMKSISISKLRRPSGMGEVVRPRAETYSGTCHQWFTRGASSIRTFPSTCVHMCSVSRVSSHASSGSSGQSVPFGMSMVLTGKPRKRRGQGTGDRLQPARPTVEIG
jgi:hypothetical protein